MLLQSPPLDSKAHLVCMVCLRRAFFYFHGDCIPKTTTSLGVAINFVTNNDVRTMPAAKTCRAKGLGIGLGFGVRVYGLGSAFPLQGPFGFEHAVRIEKCMVRCSVIANIPITWLCR